MPRLRHWGKKLGLMLLELLVVLTIASLVYNAATADSVKPANAVGKVLVGPWVISIYRLATRSDWIFRRGAYPHHPPFTRVFLDEWKRPFRVEGTLDAFRAMSRYGIQGFELSRLRSVKVPTLVLWGAQDTGDSVPAGRKSAQALRAPFHLLPQAGHLSMLAAAVAIAGEIDSFARR